MKEEHEELEYRRARFLEELIEISKRWGLYISPDSWSENWLSLEETTNSVFGNFVGYRREGNDFISTFDGKNL